MSLSEKLPFPLWVLGLDALGAVLLGLGAAEFFGGTPLLSAWTGDPQAPRDAMIAGAVMLVVAAIGIVRAVLARARTRSSSRP